jgi:hypothetical protein
MAVDYSMYSGDSRIITISIRDDAGANVDVTTAQSIRYGIFRGDGTLMFEKALLSGVTVAGSVVTVTLLPADTASIAPALYLHELQITLAAGAVATVLQGKIEIKRDYIL